MFLDQKLRNIQKRKDNLAICCDLHRRLIQVEVQGFFFGLRNAVSNVTLGVAMVQQVLRYWHQHKARR